MAIILGQLQCNKKNLRAFVPSGGHLVVQLSRTPKVVLHGKWSALVKLSGQPWKARQHEIRAL